MAKTTTRRDLFSNKAYGSVDESGANTLTFGEISTNVNIFDKVAWIVNRIEWYLSPSSLGEIAAAQDAIQCALTSSDNISTLDLDNPSVIDMLQISLKQMGGTSAGAIDHYYMPLIRNFADLPGGGLIIAPRPLYVAVVGSSLGSAVSAEMRMSFQQITLSADEYLELVDFYRIVS